MIFLKDVLHIGTSRMKTAVNLTETAKDHILKTLEGMDKPYLIFGLKGGGCAGFEYFWVPASYQDYAENGEPEMDEFIELGNKKSLVVDHHSLVYLLGSTIDYSQSFVSSGLTVDNPNASSGCGCGTSVAF